MFCVLHVPEERKRRDGRTRSSRERGSAEGGQVHEVIDEDLLPSALSEHCVRLLLLLAECICGAQ